MDYVFARETYDEVVDDIRPLLTEHWREIALHKDAIPLDPDFEVYRALDRAGALAIYTVRHAPTGNALVGYAIYFVRNHHHYRSAKWAVSDIVLIALAHRNAGAGRGLFQFAEQDLQAAGVAVMHTMTKVEHPALRTLLLELGHHPVEINLSKRL